MNRRLWLALVLAVLGTALLLWGYLGQEGKRVDGLPWRIYLDRDNLATDLAAQKISSTEVQLDMSGEGAEITGRARLELSWTGNGAPRYRLLLNPGLEVFSAQLNGEVISISRDGEFITIPGADSKCVLELEYGGIFSEGLLAAVHTPETWIFPAESFWYPLDLQFCDELQLEILAPEHFTLAVPARFVTAVVEDGQRHATWRTERPMAGMSIAGGSFERRGLAYGITNCELFAEEMPENAEEILGLAGRLASFFENQLGPLGQDILSIVLSNDPPSGGSGAHGLLVIPPKDLAGSAMLNTLALRIAEQWWPGTVGAAWLPGEPDGSAWVAQAMPRFLAWEAQRYFAGEQGLQEHLQSLPVSPQTAPFHQMDRWQFARLSLLEQQSSANVMAFVARTFSEFSGEGSLVQACRSMLKSHRYKFISSETLRSELELLSEKDFSELFRQWLHLPMRFDYAVAGAELEGENTTIILENRGNIPAPFPLTLEVESAEGVLSIMAPVGDRGGRVPVASGVKRVTLDPGLLLPDIDRENNVLVFSPDA